jgi:hypothetical protein
MIVRWIWSVPPAMEMPGTDRKISAIIPSSGEPGPASMPCGPAISACTRAAWRAMTLLASLPSEPSGPGGRPARCGYHLCGSLAAVRSAIASRQARPAAPAFRCGTGPGRDAARRRSCARIDSATVQPPPSSPITCPAGTLA